VKGLSVDDVIEVTLEGEDQRVAAWRHVARSGRTTIWLLRMRSSDTIEAVLAELRNVGCNTVGLAQLGTYAVDVPESVSIETVDEMLGRLDPETVAVAFPSMRHEE